MLQRGSFCPAFLQIILESDTDSMWALWKELFLGVLDKHAPVWPTREIKKMTFERDKLKRKKMVTDLELLGMITNQQEM